MGYATVEITKPAISYPLPTDHQALCDIFYNYWQELSRQVRENNAALCEGCDDVFVNPNIPGMLRSPHQDEIAAVMPPKVVASVVLANHNYQVGNGGWAQYDGNGYSASVDGLRLLYKGAASIGIEDADKVVDLIDEFVKRKADDESSRRDYDNDDEMDDGDTYGDLDTKFYALDTERLMQAILDRFDEVMAHGFISGLSLKKAA